jgi:parallel beta helix pectate lyase-like protein
MRRALAATLLLLGVSATGPAAAAEIGPDRELCAAINALAPGEELALQPGSYRGPCVIRRGGAAGAPIVIRAADPGQRPQIVYAGNSANVLEVKASHVRIKALAFGPTQPGVDAVRIHGGTDISVEDSEFTGVGGIAVVANHDSVSRLAVRRNIVRNSASTAMYFGCHDGLGCAVTGLLVEGNFIQDVKAPDSEIGYGVEVKLNSSAIIRDNVIMNTKGPGIMVYGSRDLLSRSVVERNAVVGARTSSGIVVGGGPVTVRNNIAALNREGGIGLEDYGRRGLLRMIAVVHNTLYKNGAASVALPESGRLRDVAIVNNAIQGRAGAATLPKHRPDTDLLGNVDCTWTPCFADPEAMDFSPAMDSLLFSSGSARREAWAPVDDFFAAPRGPQPTIGAVERRGGPIRLIPGS